MTSSDSTLGSPTLTMNATLARNWWAIAIRGVLGIVFGLIALFFPGLTMLSLVIVFAAYLFVDGIVGIVSAVRAARANERWGLLLWEGILNIVIAVIAFMWPAGAILAFVWLLAAWAIVTGGLMLGAAFRLNLDHGRWWLVLGGLVSIAYGILLLFTPFIGALVLTWWLGGYAIVFGIMLLVLSFRLRARHHEAGPSAYARA